MHFWHPDCQPTISDEEVHNHRYSFSSRIIIGEMVHETFHYEKSEKGDTECMEVCCQPDKSEEPKLISTGIMTMTGRYVLNKGSSYFFCANSFHRTITKKAVTILCRGEIETENALVLRPTGIPSICPFSVKKSESECWDIIRELLITP
jgi:hypothetical protein